MDQFVRSWHPLRLLTGLFVLWKGCIILIALTSPGPGYDTSTTLINANWNGGFSSATPNAPDNPVLKLVRWDAIYFTQMAERGHLFEQEWAFGIGISNVLSAVAGVLSPRRSSGGRLASITTAGILVSHLSHWCSVVLLWTIAQRTTRGSSGTRRSVATLAAFLHIMSPAGVFLSAPYAESLFACLNMLGFLVYFVALELVEKRRHFSSLVLLILGGVIFGLGTVVRTNGVLSGILYFFDAVSTSIALSRSWSIRSHLIMLVGLVIGGSLVGLGLVIPQYLAYQDYCTFSDFPRRRPWCSQTLPSIYTFVQSYYWNVGLFRYWTFSNIPLFLLAFPVLGILTYSSLDTIRKERLPLTRSPSGTQSRMLIHLALPQLLLAILALTSYHVQIITRISSAYPLWYIWLAENISSPQARVGKSWAVVKPETVVKGMIMYGLVQAGLYASFLPPA